MFTTLPCASITLIKFQGVISADRPTTTSTPSVYRLALAANLVHGL